MTEPCTKTERRGMRIPRGQVISLQYSCGNMDRTCCFHYRIWERDGEVRLSGSDYSQEHFRTLQRRVPWRDMHRLQQLVQKYGLAQQVQTEKPGKQAPDLPEMRLEIMWEDGTLLAGSSAGAAHSELVEFFRQLMA